MIWFPLPGRESRGLTLSLLETVKWAALCTKGMRMSTTKTLYQIDNMDCSSEEAQIRGRLGKLTGVRDLSFDLKQRKLTVEHDVDALAAIEAALREIGMNAKRT